MKHPKSLLTCAMMVIALAAVSRITQAAPTEPAAPPNTAGTVNINTATVAELMKLPGIGKAKAEAIVQYRTTEKFETVETLQAVRGIGPKLLEQLRPYVRVDGATTLHTKPSSKRSSTSRLSMPTTDGLV